VFFGLLGFTYKRRSKFFVSQIEVDIDSNPYQNTKLTPNNIPSYEAFIAFFDREGIPCEGMKELLRNSVSKKHQNKEEIK
jgi:hypothetical protein